MGTAATITTATITTSRPFSPTGAKRAGNVASGDELASQKLGQGILGIARHPRDDPNSESLRGWEEDAIEATAKQRPHPQRGQLCHTAGQPGLAERRDEATTRHPLLHFHDQDVLGEAETRRHLATKERNPNTGRHDEGLP